MAYLLPPENLAHLEGMTQNMNDDIIAFIPLKQVRGTVRRFVHGGLSVENLERIRQ